MLILRLYIFLVHKLHWLPVRGYLVLTLSPVEVGVGSVLFISHFNCAAGNFMHKSYNFLCWLQVEFLHSIISVNDVHLFSMTLYH